MGWTSFFVWGLEASYDDGDDDAACVKPSETDNTSTQPLYTHHPQQRQTLDEFVKENLEVGKGHRFAKMKFDGWYGKQ